MVQDLRREMGRIKEEKTDTAERTAEQQRSAACQGALMNMVQ